MHRGKKRQRLSLSLILLFIITPHPNLRGASASDPIPFDFVRNQIVLKVHVRASGPYHFILDTGSALSVLDYQLARRLGLPVYRTIFKANTVGENKDIIIKRTFIPHLKVGACASWKLWAYLVSLRELSRKLDMEIHGIIGYNFFKDKVVQINYLDQTVRFMDPSEYQLPVNSESSAQYQTITIPMFFAKNHVMPIIHNVRINGTAIRASIDTGSSLSLVLFPPAIKKAGIKPDPNRWTFDHIHGLAGKAPVYRGLIEQLRIDEITLENAEVILAANWGQHAKIEKRDASIGNDLLKFFIVTLDYPRKRLILTQPLLETLDYMNAYFEH